MKKFIFQYESVLRMRHAKEDFAKREYAQALEQQTSAENILQSCYDKIVQARENSSELLAQGGNSFNFSDQINGFIQGTLYRIEMQKHNIERLKSITDQKHGIYMDRYRDRKAMEKLKEKQEKEYLKEASKKQTKAIEDGVQARYARNLEDV